MSQYATELCLEVARESFGDLASRILKPLYTNGRLSQARLLRDTKLTPKQLRAGLVVLIQHRLVLWSQNEDDVPAEFEEDWQAAYDLLRSGKLLQTVEDAYGPLANTFLDEILLNGDTSVARLVQVHLEAKTEKTSTKESVELETGVVHRMINQLLQDNYFLVQDESHIHPNVDNEENIRQHLLSTRYSGTLKNHEKEALERSIQEALLDQKYSTSHRKNLPVLENERPLRTAKRARDSTSEADTRNSKKARPNGFQHQNDMDLDDDPTTARRLKDDIRVCINRDKISVQMRNAGLVKLVKDGISPVTARVYSILLNLTTRKTLACGTRTDVSDPDSENMQDDHTLENITTTTLLEYIHDFDELQDAIATQPQPQTKTTETTPGSPSHRKRKRLKVGDTTTNGNGYISTDESPEASHRVHKTTQANSHVNSHTASSDEEDTPQSDTELLRSHLLLLSSHHIPFLTHNARTHATAESWSVPFAPLTAHLIDSTIFQILFSHHGPESLRLLRMLIQKGKLEEKTLASLSLLNVKTMRAVLAAMHESGYIELQEIPRDGQRQPSRTIFLWYFDRGRCVSNILERTYKTMARLIQRLRVTREESATKAVLEKSLRSDVVGKEEEMLSREDRRVLAVFRAKEERILGELDRCDEVVATLRDFGG